VPKESDALGKLAALRRVLSEMKRALVAFSGGVDSSFLLCVAAEELGAGVAALTTRSPTAVAEDEATAISLAAALGVRHLLVDANELDIPGYADNPTNRCYFCKANLYEVCRARAREIGVEHVVDGVNADDLGDYRPGLDAAREHGVRHPLAEVGLSKSEIRVLSRQLGLPTADKPASPCLSSRFPYGTRITLDRLRRVAEAEAVLRGFGFRECRVRFHEAVARIEVPAGDLPRLLDPGVRLAVADALEALDFRYVTVDLRGFRSGSLNEGLGLRPSTTRPSEDPRGS
jgi:uncharacterized protein